MDKRCLIISYYFPPVGGGGVQRIVKLIKYLCRYDWQFKVLTAQDNLFSLPTDITVLNEIKRLVKVRRIPISQKSNYFNTLINKIIPAKSSFFYRWLSAFLYIPDMRKNWLTPLHKTLMDELRKENFDCIFVTSPPYSLALFASQITKKLSIPVILDMRDPWTNNPYKIHPTVYHFNKDRKLELQSIANIKHGISAYKSIINFYEKMIPNFNRKVWELIPNGYDDDDFRQLKDDSFNNNKFNIAFSGTFYSHINNPLPLFKAIAQLDPIMRNKLLFHHIGSTQINLTRIISRLKIENNIKLWDYLSHKACLEQLNKMNAFCFILDDRNKNSINTIGGKVYEYLRFRKPILALIPEDGEAAELINSTNSGKVISPRDTVQISKTLEEWITGKVNFKYSEIEKYTRKNQARQFLKVLNQVCGMD